MAEAAFNKIDVNKDGAISYEEVKALVASKKEIKNEQILKLIFNAVDTDGSGEIDLAEFTKFFNAVQGCDFSDDKVGLKVLYKLIDADGDGKLTKEEITSFFKRVGNEALAEQVMKGDADGDGFITLEEFVQVKL